MIAGVHAAGVEQWQLEPSDPRLLPSCFASPALEPQSRQSARPKDPVYDSEAAQKPEAFQSSWLHALARAPTASQCSHLAAAASW